MRSYIMNQEIVEKLKEHYPRDLRKQVVKSILKNEKSDDKLTSESSYQVIDQIFSYIISELNWNISNTSNWDDTPLKILSETFPKIETTQWFKNKQLHVKNHINLEGDLN